MARKPVKMQQIETGELALVPIRNETVFTRYPIHRLEKSADEKNTLEVLESSENEQGKRTTKWQVSYNTKYGEAGPLAYKIDTLVINRRVDEARQRGTIPQLIRLGSLSEIAREIGNNESNTSAVRDALFQNASAFVVTKQTYIGRDGSKQTLEFASTRYGVILTGETLPDGRRAECVYIDLNNSYREFLNKVRTRPLNWAYLKNLSPGPQRLYEMLSFEMFAAVKRPNGRARLVYSEYCACAPQKRQLQFYRANMQMRDLHAPHLASGYLAGEPEYVSCADADGNPDWEIFYTPGPAAFAEYAQWGGKLPHSRDDLELPASWEEADPQEQPLPAPGSLEAGRGRPASKPPKAQGTSAAHGPALRPSAQTPAPTASTPAAPAPAPTPPVPDSAPPVGSSPGEPGKQDEQDALLVKLVEQGVGAARALQLVREYPSGQVQRALSILAFKRKQGEAVKSSGALLADMIVQADKYVTPAGMPDPQQEAQKRAARQSAQQEARVRQEHLVVRLTLLHHQMQRQHEPVFARFAQWLEEQRNRQRTSSLFRNRSPEFKAKMLGNLETFAWELEQFALYFSANDCPLEELRAYLREHNAQVIRKAIESCPNP